MLEFGLVAMGVQNALVCSSRSAGHAVRAVVRLHNCLFEVYSATSSCCQATIASEFVSVHRERAIHIRDRMDHGLSLLKT